MLYVNSVYTGQIAIGSSDKEKHEFKLTRSKLKVFRFVLLNSTYTELWQVKIQLMTI